MKRILLASLMGVALLYGLANAEASDATQALLDRLAIADHAPDDAPGVPEVEPRLDVFLGQGHASTGIRRLA